MLRKAKGSHKCCLPLKEMVENLPSVYPLLNWKCVCTIYSIGKSEEGQELWMIDFGPVTGDSRYVPEVLLVGSLHGDEVVGYEILLQLAYHLCENYGKDFIITQVSLKLSTV